MVAHRNWYNSIVRREYRVAMRPLQLRLMKKHLAVWLGARRQTHQHSSRSEGKIGATDIRCGDFHQYIHRMLGLRGRESFTFLGPLYTRAFMQSTLGS